MKRILLLMLIISISLTSCSWSRDEKIFSKIEKAYDEYKGYKCRANIRIISGEVESTYLIEETYSSSEEYRLEILEPKESKGIIILNTDDKIFIEHPSIEQSISLVAVKSLNKQLVIGDFFEDIYRASLIGSEEIDNSEYLVFELDLEDQNRYRDTAKIWIKNKSFVPYKLNIYDDSDKLIVEIIYESFKFIKK
ncbi:MAG: outer membrane lipoprotein-sorting protein [Tissierellia bacterium]|nr:outer membrane lipoprotein-sorting protein [Tissierellia bacterium]